MCRKLCTDLGTGVQIRRRDDGGGLFAGLGETLDGTALLARLGLGNLANRPRVDDLVLRFELKGD